MPGQHPSELAQRTDVERLEGLTAELQSGGVRADTLIRQLQGAIQQQAAQIATLQKLAIIDTRRKHHIDLNTYSASITAYTPAIGDGGAGTMTIGFTPAVDCWWEVTGNIGIVQKQDAAYHPAYGVLVLNVADEDGIATVGWRLTQHSTVDTDAGRLMNGLFKLKAGIAYTASVGINPAGGTWRYYQTSTLVYIYGKAWGR